MLIDVYSLTFGRQQQLLSTVMNPLVNSLQPRHWYKQLPWWRLHLSIPALEIRRTKTKFSPKQKKNKKKQQQQSLWLCLVTLCCSSLLKSWPPLPNPVRKEMSLQSRIILQSHCQRHVKEKLTVTLQTTFKSDPGTSSLPQLYFNRNCHIREWPHLLHPTSSLYKVLFFPFLLFPNIDLYWISVTNT